MNVIDPKIIDSTVWLEGMPTRLIWLLFLILRDVDGIVELETVGNVAHRAGTTMEEAQAAIAFLEAPDPSMTNQEYEGRRIGRIDGGWLILTLK